MSSSDISTALAFLQTRGLVDPDTVRTLLADTCREADPTAWLDALGDTPASDELRAQVRQRRRDAATAFATERHDNPAATLPDSLGDLPELPIGWPDSSSPSPAMRDALGDWLYTQARGDQRLCDLVDSALHDLAGEDIADAETIEEVLDACRDRFDAQTDQTLTAAFARNPHWPPTLRDGLRAAFATDDASNRAAMLKTAFAHLSHSIAAVLPTLELNDAEDELLTLMSICRFGPSHLGWRNQIAPYADGQHACCFWPQSQQLLTLWFSYQALPDHDHATLSHLATLANDHGTDIDTAAFLARWRDRLTPALRAELEAELTVEDSKADDTAAALAPAIAAAANDSDADEPPAMVVSETTAAPSTDDQAAPLAATDPASATAPDEDTTADDAAAPAAEAVVEPARADWLVHLRHFFDEHWAIIAGALMILCGTSLLAFFTWDKHWLVRYTLLPGLLAALTAGIAHLGGWLGRRDAGLIGTTTILTSLAIAMLPLNAMVPALMANDPSVTWRPVTVSLAILIFGLGAAFGLRHWCGTIHDSFRRELTLTLGITCIMIPLLAASHALGLPRTAMPLTIAIAASLSMLVTMRMLVVHSRRLRDDEALRAEHYAWFIGGTITAVLLQTIIWPHIQLTVLPLWPAYGPLLIAGGWLILLCEGRADRHREQHSNESFLGYAAILLGVMLAMAHPAFRPICLALAAWAWLDQARWHRHPAHHWIGSTLGMAAALSLAVIPGLPDWLRAPLAMGIAVVGMLSGITLAPRIALAPALAGVGQSAVVFIAVATVACHWHGLMPTWACAVTIVLATVGLLIHGCQRQRWRDALLAAAMATVSLPYLGCVDLSAQNLHGNHLVFGLTCLAIIWSIIGRLPGTAIIGATRSLTGLTWGLLAIAALLLRVGMEGGRAGEMSGLHMALDYGGTIGMSVVLALVAWWSRSLLPGFLCAATLVIIFPELKARFADQLATLHWGSGLGGAITGLVLMGAAFVCSIIPKLQQLGPGDELRKGHPFPLLRHDHSLITWPLLAAAAFLSLRVSTWTPLLHLHHGDLSWATGIAMIIAAITMLAMLAYRSPLGRSAPGRCRPAAPRWWRRGLPLACCLSTGSASLAVAYKAGVLTNPTHLLTWPLATWALMVALLELRGPWARYERWAAAARIYTLTVRLAIPAGLALLFCCLAGVPPLETRSLAMITFGLAVWDTLRSGRLRAGIWATCLLWSWLVCWAGLGAQTEIHPDWLLYLDASFWQRLAPVILVMGSAVLLREYLVRKRHADLAPALFAPLFHSTLVALMAAAVQLLIVMANRDAGPGLTTWICLLAAVGLYAWANRSWSMTTIGIAAVYLVWQQQRCIGVSNHELGESLSNPAHLMLLALAWASVPLVLQAIGSRARRLLIAQQPARLPQGSSTMLAAAALIACAAGVLTTWAWPAFHAHGADILVSWSLLLPALLVAATGLRPADLPLVLRRGNPTAIDLPVNQQQDLRQAAGYALLGILITAMIWTLQISLGATFAQWDLPFGHLCAIGLGATILFLAGLGKILIPPFQQRFRRANIWHAAAIIMLLAGSNLAHPDLALISWQRLLSAAVLALIAGRAARHLAAGELSDDSRYRLFGIGIYHGSLALAIACLALLIPVLRQPSTAMIALSLPALWLYLRSEQRDTPQATDYRNSTVVLSGLLLFFITFHAAFTMIFFPESAGAQQSTHYHHNAAIMCVLGLILMRCVGLGADRIFADLGGLACLAGSYFLLTWLPGLSPFHHPLAASWSAIALAHAWTVITAHRSPLRSGLRRLLHCDDTTWTSLRRSWGLMMLVAVYLMTGIALASVSIEQRPLLPVLLLGLATVSAHHAALRPGRWRFRLALATCLLALQLGWFIPQTISLAQGAWGIAALWALLLAWQPICQRFQLALTQRNPLTDPFGIIAIAASALWSLANLEPQPGHALAYACGLTLIAANTPVSTGQRGLAWLALLIPPVLLGHFLRALGIDLLGAESLVLFGLLALGMGHVGHAVSGATATAENNRPLAWWVLQLIRRHGHHLTTWLSTAALLCLTASTTLLIISAAAPSPRLLVELITLGAVSTVVWYRDAQRRQSIWRLLLAQLALAITLSVGRQFLRYTIPDYQLAWDVWGALLLSLIMAGIKSMRPAQERHIHLPLAWSVAAMPLATLSWVLFNGLGTNLAAIALCLHSVSFIYLGGHNRRSPFHILATLGFVSLVVLTAWNNLGLHSLQAFVLPLGAGMLVLCQLLRDTIAANARRTIVGATLSIMIASCAWYAVNTGGHLLLTNGVLLVTGTLLLIASSFVRMRAYFFSGWAGILIALGSLSYHGIYQLDRGLRMSLIGAIILALGTGLVAGTVILKAKRERILAWLEAWKERYPE